MRVRLGFIDRVDGKLWWLVMKLFASNRSVGMRVAGCVKLTCLL